MNKKRPSNSTIMLFALVTLLSSVDFAMSQDNKNDSLFAINADIVSRYIWRGTDFGNAPAIQPSLSFSVNGFTIGAWGSYSISSNTGGLEADLYLNYSFGFGLDIGITDYYFPEERLILLKNQNDSLTDIKPVRNDNYFNYTDKHLVELNLTYVISKIELSANYLFYGNNNDVYAEVGFLLTPNAKIFVGGGNESYTKSNEFGFTNAGISINKEIKISDWFSLPVFGSVIINPDREQIHLVFGISL